MSDLSQMSDDELMKVAGLSDRSDEELMQIAGIKTKIPFAEKVLQKAAKYVSDYSGIGVEEPDNPFMRGISSTMRGLKQTPGLGSYMQAHDVKSDVIGEAMPDNPVGSFVLDTITNPENLVGMGVVKKGAGSLFRSLKSPSTPYGKSVESAKGNVDFMKVINKHIDDPLVKKVLDKSGVIDKYGQPVFEEGGKVSSKLNKLNSNEVQDFINDVKVGQTKAMLSGDVVKSNQVCLSKFFADLSKAQNELSGMKGAKKLYGASKGIRKFGSSATKKILGGSLLGLGGKLGYDVGKAISRQ